MNNSLVGYCDYTLIVRVYLIRLYYFFVEVYRHEDDEDYSEESFNRQILNHNYNIKNILPLLIINNLRRFDRVGIEKHLKCVVLYSPSEEFCDHSKS